MTVIHPRTSDRAAEFWRSGGIQEARSPLVIDAIFITSFENGKYAVESIRSRASLDGIDQVIEISEQGTRLTDTNGAEHMLTERGALLLSADGGCRLALDGRNHWRTGRRGTRCAGTARPRPRDRGLATGGPLRPREGVRA